MIFIITLFATCVLVISIIGVIKPLIIADAIERHYRRPGLHYVSILVRVILGAGLLLLAEDTRTPLVVKTLAVILLLTAMFEAIKGRYVFKKTVRWLLKYQHLLLRSLAIFGVLFATFLLRTLY
ncbi:hypothetical protein [Thalassotalea sp. PS06]|uniref:hypothetical protein n=1 Tax=Thalassotalea sp. PS06 TaxID=2594005 RepID=UPI001165A385|nr:hypothetical protein [Thalassotalea sp. PS06]QDP02509.1 hypothetical protein FNC98_14810 [Thalassotalea sp. PS06]